VGLSEGLSPGEPHRIANSTGSVEGLVLAKRADFFTVSHGEILSEA